MKMKFIVPYVLSGASAFFSLNTSVAHNDKSNDTEPATVARVDSAFNSIDSVAAEMTIPYATAIRETGRDVVYVFNNGSARVRRGGTRAWRNNNPGCIRYSQFARDHGAIGRAGNFAVFPDAQTGAAAIGALLQTDKYRDLTIAAAITKYAPPHENDTRSYQQRLAKMTGLPITLKLRDLNAQQLSAVVGAIRVLEGWRAGSEVAVQEHNDTILASARTHDDIKMAAIHGQHQLQRQMSR